MDVSLESLTAAQGFSALGTAIRAGGQVWGGLQSRDVADYNAAILEQEAVIARSLPPIVRGQAAKEAQRIREAGQEVTGAQKTRFAAGGVSVASGSPMLVMLESIRRAGEDAFLARYKGDVRAWELEGRARGLRGAADIRRRIGRQSLLAGIMGAGSTLLAGSTALKAKPGKVLDEDVWPDWLSYE